MNVSERDAYVVDRLAALALQGVTGQQAVNELVRTAGFVNVALAGHDQAAMLTDVAGLQTAVAALTVSTTRTDTVVVATTARGRIPTTAQPDSWRHRVVAAGR